MQYIGIDIGSISVNLIVTADDGTILSSQYVRHKGKAFEVGKNCLRRALRQYDVDFIAATGTGTTTFAPLIGASRSTR